MQAQKPLGCLAKRSNVPCHLPHTVAAASVHGNGDLQCLFRNISLCIICLSVALRPFASLGNHSCRLDRCEVEQVSVPSPVVFLDRPRTCLNYFSMVPLLVRLWDLSGFPLPELTYPRAFSHRVLFPASEAFPAWKKRSAFPRG